MGSFIPKPDVLDLVAKIEESEEIRLHKRSCAFGNLEGEILMFRGIPMGVTVDLTPYHSFVQSFRPDSTLVMLAPALRSTDPFPRPSPESFENSLSQLLSDGLPSWTLICERDCDQEPVPHFVAGSKEAKEAFRQLFMWLRGDPDFHCPTFVVTKGDPSAADDG